MTLYRLTVSTLFRRKSWAICVVAVGILPFILQQVSMGSENPALLKPALAQATWGMTLLSSLLWGLYTAAKQGDSNAHSGVGEYFLTTGISPLRQFLQITLAVLTFVAPLFPLAALITCLAASPSLPDERQLWIATNAQYILIFLLFITPLLMLTIALASRFGSLSAFFVTFSLAAFGLYGIDYLKDFGSIQDNPVLKTVWNLAPHYHFADPTERLRFKLGPISAEHFPALLSYFVGISLVYFAIARITFQARTTR